MKKVALILSGCGHFDGAEIRESILSMVELEEKNIEYDIYAPDINQHHVLNHITGEEISQKRNVLVEAARVARGKIEDLKKLNSSEYDGLVLPGGFGVAKNLSSFAFEGSAGSLLGEFKKTINAFLDCNKPICAICISPAVMALALENKGVTLSSGADENVAMEITKLGNKNIVLSPHEAYLDEKYKVISSPAYMYDDAKLIDVKKGINQAISLLAQEL